MNCERCKNRKATLFYADEGGGRHALCAVCGEKQSKPIVFSTQGSEKEERKEEFLPPVTLFSLINEKSYLPRAMQDSDKHLVCKGCGLTAEQLCSSGELGCVECYEAFSSLLLPTPTLYPASSSARMPSARRARLDKQRRLTELRVKLRQAVDREDYELAATLRDEIRSLDT